MSMSRRLTDEEIHQNRLQREERQREKDMELRLDERSYTILNISQSFSKFLSLQFLELYKI